MNLLTVSTRDVLNLDGKGGEPFVDCVNRLLRAEAAMSGAAHRRGDLVERQ